MPPASMANVLVAIIIPPPDPNASAGWTLGALACCAGDSNAAIGEVVRGSGLWPAIGPMALMVIN